MTAGAHVEIVNVDGEITGHENGRDRFKVVLDELVEPGPYRFEVVATKPGLQTDRVSVAVVHLMGQDLTIESPRDDAEVRRRMIIVRGTVGGDADIRVNGERAVVGGATGDIGPRRFRAEVPLQVGRNLIVVRATERYHVSRTKTIRVARLRSARPRCDRANYAGACVPPHPPDLDCDQIEATGFKSVGGDPHDLDDEDADQIACEG